MKLFLEDDSPFLSRLEWKKVFTFVSLFTIFLYIIAMICSLNDINIFIMRYQNETMDRIEEFMRAHGIQSLISWLFTTLEFTITASFILKKRCPLYFVAAFYIIPVIIAFIFPEIPTQVYSFVCLFSCIAIIFLDQLITNKNIKWAITWRGLVRVAISQVISYSLQLMIFVIKSGEFTLVNTIMNMSAHFIYAIEFDIALSVLLFTVSLYIDRGKGDSKRWAIYHTHSGSSQTSKTKLQRLSWKKTLTKRQRTRLFWLWVRLYVIQILGFAFLMILPFLTGKVLEFLIMYLAFAVTRYLLGFKYSLHFKNETLCITVGAVVFGILTLAVPFFYVEIIMAVLIGTGLAVFLHLSYKYKGFWLFAKMAKPDKYAALNVIFERSKDENYILRQCKYKGLDEETSKIVCEYMDGYKLSYISFRYNYSMKTIDRKLTEAIKKLNK